MDKARKSDQQPDPRQRAGRQPFGFVSRVSGKRTIIKRWVMGVDGMPEAWEVVSVIAIFLFVLLLALAVIGLADLMRTVGRLLGIALPFAHPIHFVLLFS
jgi:hypothetical protein